ncbi:MAG: Pr6Pr family membrane protein [Flavitalea sp.]
MANIPNEDTLSDKPSFRVYASIGAIAGWATLLLQLYLLILHRKAPVPETIIRYFSFFTILSNILVALCYTYALLKPKGASLFTRVTTLTAVTVYITIVGLVYNIILRPLWDPQGWQKVADESLHSVIPILYLFFWIIYVPKKELQWSNIFPWMIFPFLYIACVVIRGAFSGFYPYPFVDVTTIGYSRLLINSLLFVIVFLGFSALFVGLAKFTGKGKP